MKGKWCIMVTSHDKKKTIVVGPFEDQETAVKFGRRQFLSCAVVPTILYNAQDYSE